MSPGSTRATNAPAMNRRANLFKFFIGGTTFASMPHRMRSLIWNYEPDARIGAAASHLPW
jgi:hypothetical protein